MTTFDELHNQNHHIVELTNVLLYLVKNRSMCDTDIACDLFFEFVTRVREHMDIVDKEFYGILLRSPDRRAHDTAELFMSGALEIKRIFQRYLKKWSKEHNKQLRIANHDDFVQDTEFMFNAVRDRIQRETENLYPLVRKLHEAA